MKKALILFGLIFSIPACNTTEPPPPEKTITLSLEDAASIEAWIKLTTTNFQLPAAITLKQNNTVTQDIVLSNADTLLYIDSLFPNQQYTFQASSIQNQVYSNKLSITTMDTTSHDITWEVETIGGPGSFVLDVAIINENAIWVVGEFQTAESDTPYNAANWNGQQWDLIRIPAVPWYNPDIFVYDEISTLIAFESDDIWFSEDLGTIVHWDENSYTSYIIGANQAQGTIKKFWGLSSDEIYLVGTNGSITKFNGSSFIKMNSNTDINLTDIYGTPDGIEVWACGWNNSDGRSVLLRLNNNRWEILWERGGNTNNLPYSTFLSTLWTSGRSEFLLTGIPDGIVRHSISNLNFTREDNFVRESFGYRIRGDETNNVFLAGDFASIWHFNGASWKRYDYLINQEDRLRSIHVKNGIVAAVGFGFSNILPGALIIRGRR
jgi:hypothetical protein